MDGVLYKIVVRIYDVVALGFFWLFFSIPLFTIGASTTALFFVTMRILSNQEGYLWQDFWTAFKSNFREATLTWIMLAAIGLLFYLNINNIGGINNPTLQVLILSIQIPFCIELALITIYIFPIYARFDVKFTSAMKSAFYMANRHILTSIPCAFIAMMVILIVYLDPFYFWMAMGIYAYFSSFLFLRLFRKYYPNAVIIFNK